MRMANTHPLHLAPQKEMLLGMQLPTTGESKIFVRFRNEIINNSPSYQNPTNEMNTNRLVCLQEEKQVDSKGHLMAGISATQKGIFCVLGFWVSGAGEDIPIVGDACSDITSCGCVSDCLS